MDDKEPTEEEILAQQQAHLDSEDRVGDPLAAVEQPEGDA